MRFFLIVVGILVLGAAGLVVYASLVKAPEAEIEVVIPDDDLPS